MSDKTYYYQKERVESELKTFYEERDKERKVVKKREAYFEDIERKARQMATEIISQNSIYSKEEENKDALEKGSKSVYSLPTLDLLKEAEKSRSEYNKNRTNLMQELLKKNTDLKRQINNLNERVNIDNNSITSRNEEIKRLRKEILENIKNTDNKTSVTYVTETQPAKKAKEVIKKEASKMEEQIGKRRVDDILDSIESEENAKKGETTDKEKIDALTTKLKKTDDGVWERARNLFAIIGGTGLSLKVDIVAEYKKRIAAQGKEKDVSKIINNTDYAFEKLVLLGIVDKGTFSYWSSKQTYYVLTGIGIKVYKNLTGESPEISQITTIMSFHNNPEHGYGIIKLAEFMREYPDRFKEISEYNKGNKGKVLKVLVRENNGKKVQKTIEPDIAFIEVTPHGEEERFIEYELVTQSHDEYFAKINKYVNYGQNSIIFIFPNTDLRNNFKRYVKNFLSEKKKVGIEYPDLEFFLYTVDEFKDMCEEHDNWKPYDPADDTRYSKTAEELKAEQETGSTENKITKIL